MECIFIMSSSTVHKAQAGLYSYTGTLKHINVLKLYHLVEVFHFSFRVLFILNDLFYKRINFRKQAQSSSHYFPTRHLFQ